MMTIKEIVSYVAKKEGKKVQTSVGNVREIVRILCELVYADEDALKTMIKNGKRLAKRKKK